MLTKDICQRTGLKGTSRVALLLCVSQLQQLVNDILFVHQYWNHACAQCNLYEACCTRNILEQPLIKLIKLCTVHSSAVIQKETSWQCTAKCSQRYQGNTKEKHLDRKNLLVQMFQPVFPCSKSGGTVHEELLAVHHWFTSFEKQHYYICTTTNKRQVVSRHDKPEENSLKINCI